MTKSVRTVSRYWLLTIVVYGITGWLLGHVIAAPLKRIHLNIPKQPLSEQLAMLSAAYDVGFTANAALLKDRQGQPLSGQYKLTDALNQLLNKLPLSATVTSAGIVISASAVSVESSTLPMEEIRVTGLYPSLTRSRQFKQREIAVSDAIAAQDMTRYPDLNVAEALQRVPGVTITREAGEGRQVSLRGLFPDFTMVTLNGMRVLSNNDSPMDSRVQKQHDRSFDFNIFAPQLFDHIQVFKSYRADQAAGGLAGTVALQTVRPFQAPGEHAMLSASVGKNDYQDNPSRRLSGLLSTSNESWGALLSAVYSQRRIQEQGANTFRWRPIAGLEADISALQPELQQAWRAGDIVMPRGNRYSLWQTQQTRQGVNAALQYRQADLQVNVDAIWARLTAERREDHLYPRGAEMTPIIPTKTQITAAQLDRQQALVFAQYRQAQVGSESRRQDVSTDYQQLVISAEQQLSSRWQLAWQLGWQQSDYGLPFSAKVYSKAQSDISIDYRPDRFYPQVHYTAPLTQVEPWSLQEIDIEHYAASINQQQLALSSVYQWRPWLSVSAGIDIHQADYRRDWLSQDDLMLMSWQQTPAQPAPQQRFVTQRHPQASWLALNVEQIIADWQVDADYQENLGDAIWQRVSSAVVEHHKEAYLMANWQHHDWSWQVGFRWIDSASRVDVDQPLLDDDSYRLNYRYWLPTLNLSYDWQDWVAQIGISRNIGRPLLDDLTEPVSFGAETATLRSYNRQLKPYLSNNFDVSLSYYGDDDWFLSLAGFYKLIDDYVISQVQQKRFVDTGLSNRWQGVAIDDQQWVNWVTKQNVERVRLSGIEAQWQWRWSFLPAPFNHLGLAIQGTYNHGNMQYTNAKTGQPLFTKSLPYLSRYTGSVALYYEDSSLSARLAWSYRDRYLARVDSQTLTEEDETGFHASSYLDASLAWQLSTHWELRIDALNLTNEREEQYSDSSDRAYNSTTYGRSAFIGMSYRF